LLWDESAEPASTRWLPLILISQTGLWIGLDGAANWIVGRKGGRIESVATGVTPSWLPLLDLDPVVLAAEIEDVGTRHHLPKEVLTDTLPVDEAISIALGSKSQHWTERAVAWLMTRPPRPDHLDLLRALINASWVNQRTRQRAKKLVT
jgi:hypothetical protein